MSTEYTKEKIYKLKSEREKDLKKSKNRLDIEFVIDRIKKVGQIYPHMTREEKALFWHILIKQIIVKSDRIHIVWTVDFPASELRLKLLQTTKKVRVGGDEGI